MEPTIREATRRLGFMVIDSADGLATAEYGYCMDGDSGEDSPRGRRWGRTATTTDERGGGAAATTRADDDESPVPRAARGSEIVE